MGGAVRDLDAAGSLVGRDAVLTVLRTAVDRAVAGAGSCLLLAGEPGIGKTATVTAAATYAEHARAHVAWGGCQEGAPGYWPWPDVLRAVLPGTEAERHPRRDDLAVVVPAWAAHPSPSTPVDAAGDRFRAFDAVATVLVEAAAVRPLVVVLDDLQWADAGALRLLEFVCRQVERRAVLVLGTYRDTEIDQEHPLHRLLGERPGGLGVVTLGGLTVGEVGELLGRVTGAEPDPDTAADVRRRSAGNPFFVWQLAGLPGSGGASGVGGAGGTGGAVPATIREVLARRRARLPQPSARLVEAAAVLGPDFDTGVLATLAEAAGTDVITVLEPAVRARIVEPSGVAGVYRFVHDLFRETAYDDLDAAERMRLHTRAAGALEQAGGRPAELAYHHGRSLPAGDAAAARRYAVEAARDAAARLAYEEAVRHWLLAVRAAELAEGTAPPGLLVELADAQRVAGELGHARAGYADAAAAAQRRGEPDVVTRAALGLQLCGTPVEESRRTTIGWLRTALAAPASAPPGRVARLRAALARELADGPDRDLAAAAEQAASAVEIARGSDDPAALASALFAMNDLAWAPGTARRRLGLAAEMATAAAAADSPDLRWEALFARFVALVELGDPEAATAHLELERLAAALRRPRLRYLAFSRRAALAMAQGDYAGAGTLIDEAKDLADALGEPDAGGVYTTQLLVLAMARDGWPAVAGLSRRFPDGVAPPEFTPELRAFDHLAADDPAAAAAVLRGVRPAGERAVYRWRALAAAAWDVEVGAAATAPDVCAAARTVLDGAADEWVVIGGAVAVLGPVSLYLGLAEAAAGRWDAAVSWFEDALDRARRFSARGTGARASYELARALLARGGPDDVRRADPLLRSAAETADRLRLAPVRAGLARLRAAGSAEQDEFRRDGEVWTLRYAGRTARLRDAKGLHDIATLLAAPGQDVPATRLLAGAVQAEPATGADPVLDDRAKAAYRARLADLDTEIAAAEADHDPGRGERYRDERDALVAALAEAYGLGGRARRLGDPGERARTTVTARIRDALRRIEREHPELAAHLRASVHTGRSCTYRPTEPMHWHL